MLAVVRSPKGRHMSIDGIVTWSENPSVRVGDVCPKSVRKAVEVAKDFASEAADTLREQTTPRGPNPLAPPPSRLDPSMLDENGNLRTDGMTVVKLPEGLVNRRRQDGSLMTHRKTGDPILTTVDYRSDKAVTGRVTRTMSKWGKGRVTGSTSGGQWGVPARPGIDDEANVGDIKKDLRTMDMERHRQATRKPPTKGKRVAPKRDVRRTYVD